MKEEALKLADELKGYYWENEDEELTPSKLIRRLVEELDEKNYRILELTKRYKALTWNDKQSEPVAWWDGKEPNVLGLSYHQNDYCPIPLYTTPQTKPLLVKVVQDHIEDLWNCIRLFRSYKMDNTANEMEVAIKELEEAIDSPQTKPLSDEELDNLIIDKGHLDCVLDFHPTFDSVSVMRFELRRLARAIEERHGIK